MHISKEVLDENKQIDPNKIDLVARLGGNWYSRTNGDALFEVTKPIMNLGIGIDMIPENIRNSNILTGNNLGQLGNIEKIPSNEEIAEYKKSIVGTFSKEKAHHMAKELLEKHKVEEAWKMLLSIDMSK
jgi:hypothetical protein